MNHNILLRFVEQAKLKPNKSAIIDKDGTVLSFGTLLKKVEERASYFRNRGLEKGDRVLVFIPMSIDLYINILALFYLGAVAVFVDQWSDKKRIIQSCETAECKGMISGWKLRLLAFFIGTLRKIPIKIGLDTRVAKLVTIAECAEDDPALITFTTGSTGVPKAPIRSHYLLEQQLLSLEPLLDIDQDRIDMPMLPIVLLLNLAIGRTSVIAQMNASRPQTFDPALLWKQCLDQKVSSITGSPYFIESLGSYHTRTQQTHQLEKIISGGGPVFPSMAALMIGSIAKEGIVVFGSTEAEPIAHIPMDQLAKEVSLRNGLCVGKVDKSATVRIIPISNQAIPQHNDLPNLMDEVGEIIVSGAHVLKAYFKNEAAFFENKIIDRNGQLWHRTGDAGRLDANGNLFLYGRCKQIIYRNNKSFYPFLVEYALANLPHIKAGTALEKNNQVIIVIEDDTVDQKKEKEIQSLGIPYDKILALPKLPRDKRHVTKIDYDALAKLID